MINNMNLKLLLLLELLLLLLRRRRLALKHLSIYTLCPRMLVKGREV